MSPRGFSDGQSLVLVPKKVSADLLQVLRTLIGDVVTTLSEALRLKGRLRLALRSEQGTTRQDFRNAERKAYISRGDTRNVEPDLRLVVEPRQIGRVFDRLKLVRSQKLRVRDEQLGDPDVIPLPIHDEVEVGESAEMVNSPFKVDLIIEDTLKVECSLSNRFQN